VGEINKQLLSRMSSKRKTKDGAPLYLDLGDVIDPATGQHAFQIGHGGPELVALSAAAPLFWPAAGSVALAKGVPVSVSYRAGVPGLTVLAGGAFRALRSAPLPAAAGAISFRTASTKPFKSPPFIPISPSTASRIGCWAR